MIQCIPVNDLDESIQKEKGSDSKPMMVMTPWDTPKRYHGSLTTKQLKATGELTACVVSIHTIRKKESHREKRWQHDSADTH